MACKRLFSFLVIVIVLHACAAKPWESVQSKREYMFQKLLKRSGCGLMYRNCEKQSDCRKGYCSLDIGCIQVSNDGTKLCLEIPENVELFKRDYPGHK